MNTFLKSVLSIFISAFILSGAPLLNAADEFTPDLDKISLEASKDKDGFNAELAAEFGIPLPKLNEMSAKFGMKNGDIYFACELSKQAKRPIDDVINQYQKNKSRGWGFIAKEMGIKPGSPEFKALKAKTKGKHEKIKGKNKEKHGGKGKKN